MSQRACYGPEYEWICCDRFRPEADVCDQGPFPAKSRRGSGDIEVAKLSGFASDCLPGKVGLSSK